tara:strand:- start:45519 stop:45959 length:441 start_codon:yes stop_codon:yes gene_type:complete
MNKEEVLLKNKVINVIWSAFIVATLVYGFVIFYLNQGNIDGINFNTITLTLLVFGFSNLIIGYTINQKMPSLLKKNTNLDLETLYSKFMTLNIISWALIESAAALGLACSFIEKNGIYFLTLGIPALICLFLTKPRPEILKRIVLS